jgi:hypothetical protein
MHARLDASPGAPGLTFFIDAIEMSVIIIPNRNMIAPGLSVEVLASGSSELALTAPDGTTDAACTLTEALFPLGSFRDNW